MDFSKTKTPLFDLSKLSTLLVQQPSNLERSSKSSNKGNRTERSITDHRFVTGQLRRPILQQADTNLSRLSQKKY